MLRMDSRGVFLGLMALAVLAPVAALFIVALATIIQGGLGALNLLAGSSRRPAEMTAGAPADQAPFFSVHIATHEEPPQMVIETLRALARQQGAPGYEVILLDNNTRDPALWHPVERACRELGPNVRFYHVDGVEGAKAGALNIALRLTHPAASHIVIVDADYQVEPDFLATAAAELRRSDDDFLQFPQAYRKDGGAAAGLSLELADYFLRHAREADCAGAMLLTGTLSVIRRSALEAVGGWSARTITEDAELGLRLRRFGFRGRFVDRIVGRGLLPMDFSGLALQRYRWTAGNAATISGGLGGLPTRSAVQVFAQLTAWANMALPLTAGLIGGACAVLLGHDGRAATLLTNLSGFGLLLVALSVCLPMVLSTVLRGRPSLAVILDALSVRIAMIVPSALASVDALLGRSGSFERTAKDETGASEKVGWLFSALFVVGLMLLWNVSALPWFSLTGAALLLLPLPLARATCERLAAYRASLRITEEVRT